MYADPEFADFSQQIGSKNNYHFIFIIFIFYLFF